MSQFDQISSTNPDIVQTINSTNISSELSETLRGDRTYTCISDILDLGEGALTRVKNQLNVISKNEAGVYDDIADEAKSILMLLDEWENFTIEQKAMIASCDPTVGETIQLAINNNLLPRYQLSTLLGSLQNSNWTVHENSTLEDWNINIEQFRLYTTGKYTNYISMRKAGDLNVDARYAFNLLHFVEVGEDIINNRSSESLNQRTAYEQHIILLLRIIYSDTGRPQTQNDVNWPYGTDYNPYQKIESMLADIGPVIHKNDSLLDTLPDEIDIQLIKDVLPQQAF